MGNVVQAGVGQAPARQAAIHGGIPDTVPAMTVNKVCGSGLEGGDAGGAGDPRGRRRRDRGGRDGIDVERALLPAEGTQPATGSETASWWTA